MVSVSIFLQFKSSRQAQIHVLCNASGEVDICCGYIYITESVTDETAREVNGEKRLVAVSLVTSKA
jgi:hypothetical protein